MDFGVQTFFFASSLFLLPAFPFDLCLPGFLMLPCNLPFEFCSVPAVRIDHERKSQLGLCLRKQTRFEEFPRSTKAETQLLLLRNPSGLFLTGAGLFLLALHAFALFPQPFRPLCFLLLLRNSQLLQLALVRLLFGLPYLPFKIMNVLVVWIKEVRPGNLFEGSVVFIPGKIDVSDL